jgi:uncharacterized membrane protein HdeD (DUF308 family)
MDLNPLRTGATTGSTWKASGGGSFFLALILFALGILALLFADVFSTVSIAGFGVLLAAGGLTELLHAFSGRGAGDRFILELLSGLLSIAVGIVLFTRPIVGATSAGLLVGAWLLATGLFRAVTATMDRYRYWGWDLAYGILSILLGWWVMGALPHSATRLLGTVIAIELMVRSVSVMSASVALQRRKPSPAPAR